MRVIGLEPTRLAAPEPKSGASTNSATPARVNTYVETAVLLAKLFPVGERYFDHFESFCIFHFFEPLEYPAKC